MKWDINKHKSSKYSISVELFAEIRNLQEIELLILKFQSNCNYVYALGKQETWLDIPKKTLQISSSTQYIVGIKCVFPELIIIWVIYPPEILFCGFI